MSKRFDNKKLLYIFGTLFIGLLLTFLLKVPKEKATLKGALIQFDTSAVSKIIITPKKTAGNPFEFIKENGKWTVRQGNITADPAEGAVRNIFSELLSLKAQSLAAVDKSKSGEFELTDSLSTGVQFLNSKGKELAGIQIGKFSYRQTPGQYGYYNGNNVEGTSYVRVDNEKEIYGVDGFLAVSFSGNFSDWRNKSLVRCKKDDILKITFFYPGDSSFTLQKKDHGWAAGDTEADSVSVERYLNTLSYINGEGFKDDFKPGADPEYTITVEGNNLLNFSVRCYPVKEEDDEYILTSSLNPDVFFTGKKTGTFSQIFKPRKYFLKK